jgi:hypothetical protein
MDLLNFERDRDKDRNRKNKRGTRGRRLVALPDRDPVKTNRSRISGGKDESGNPITLAAIPKDPLLLKSTPQRPKAAPRRAAAIAAKANITTMTSELQQGDYSNHASPENVQVVSAAPRSKRNRVLTGSPEVETTRPTTAVGIKQEEQKPLITASATMDQGEMKRPESSWTCSHCHRPEAVLDDKRKFDGPVHKPTLCSDCGKLNTLDPYRLRINRLTCFLSY